MTVDSGRDRRAELERAALEEHIQALVDAAPPLNAETRDRLAVLLRHDPRDTSNNVA